MALPVRAFSSFISRLKNCLILARAEPDFTYLSQSHEGPLLFGEVSISTTSPVCSTELSGTMREFTFAPTHLLPTSEWMA